MLNGASREPVWTSASRDRGMGSWLRFSVPIEGFGILQYTEKEGTVGLRMSWAFPFCGGVFTRRHGVLDKPGMPAKLAGFLRRSLISQARVDYVDIPRMYARTGL